MNNIQIVVFLYIILRVILFVSIIGCHFILCDINSFLYLQIQLYDTFSLSLSIMCIGYCAIELRIFPSCIYKATEAKDLCAV